MSTFINWSLDLVFAQHAPIASAKVGFKFFYFFFVFVLVAVAYCILLYPETRGKILEQMDRLFGDQVLPHALQDPAAAEEVMQDKYRVGNVVSHTEVAHMDHKV